MKMARMIEIIIKTQKSSNWFSIILQAKNDNDDFVEVGSGGGDDDGDGDKDEINETGALTTKR